MVATSPPTAGFRAVADVAPGRAARPRWWDRRTLAAGFAFVGYLALALALARGLEYHEPDSLSRTASAYQALMGREPRLAVLGAVWTPLPALAQMPFLLLLWPFGLQDVAGAVVSAAATVATLGLLDHLARSVGMPGVLRIGLLLLYAVHPMVILFAANGQTEALFLLLVVASVCQLVRWADDRNVERVLIMGYLAAAAFLVRYEAVPLALALGAGMVARQLVRAPRAGGGLVAILAYFGVPLLLVVGWWIKFNWEVTGDPLFFFRGPYSIVAQTAHYRQPDSDLYPYYRDPALALRFVIERLALLSPSFAVLLPAVVAGAVARRSWSAGLAAWVFATLGLFAAYQLSAGQSAAHLRYYLAAVPAGLALACLFWRLAPSRARPVVGALLLLLAAAAIPTTLAGMTDRAVGRMEWGMIAYLDGRPYEPRIFTRFRSERAAAGDFDARAERTPVLIDMVTGFPVVAFSRAPGQFVSTTDSDFEQILANPYGQVGHILVHDPRDPTDPNPMSEYGRVLAVHPDLLNDGSSWATLEREYGAWKLFRVVAPPPTQAP